MKTRGFQSNLLRHPQGCPKAIQPRRASDLSDPRFTPCKILTALLEAVSEAAESTASGKQALPGRAAKFWEQFSITKDSPVKSFIEKLNQYMGVLKSGPPICLVSSSVLPMRAACIREIDTEFASGFFEGKPRRKTQNTSRDEAQRL